MIGNFDTYYSLPEVSNSLLSEMRKLLYGGIDIDPTEAYRFGNLIDAMITEEHRVNYLACKVDDDVFSREQFEQAKQMRKAYFADPMCAQLHKHATGQSVMRRELEMNYRGIDFTLPARCKWDLWMPKMKWGADIKSTACTTQKQVEASIEHFDYDRSRAWYMDIAGSDKDMLIFISKVNFKVFKVPIQRGDRLYNQGKEKYLELAFKYFTHFHDFSTIFNKIIT